MSRMDQRVRAVELRPISLLTSGEVEAAVAIGDAAVGPETVVSSSAPYQFRKIEDAYIYPKALTGLNEDRVEIYLESDLSVVVGERLEVSGIHGTSTEDIDVDGDNFTVKYLDTPPWDDRASYKHDPTQDQRAGVTITNAYSFKPETVAPPTWSTRKRLQTRRLVDSYSITGTTVTLTMNANHKFQVGNVIFVGIFSENSTAYGADGLFTVTAITDNTIEYELFAGVDTPTGTLTPATDVYVFPVAREWAQDGSIWIDSSNNTTYYWDGVRWVEYTPDTTIGADGDPPAPATNFTISDVAATYGPYFTAYSKVTLSWTAPTLTAAGDPLTDLLGYKIQWRDSPTAEWKELLVNNSALTTYVFDQEINLQQGETYYFRLYAYDSGNQDSTAATATHTTSFKAGDHTTYPPTDPVATSRLGTIKVQWDGRLKTGASTSIAAPSDISVLKIYSSTVPGFVPSATNLVASTRVFGSDGGFDVLTDLSYGTSYYIKIKVADTSGVESAASAQVTAQVTPLVDADLIYSTLDEWPFNGGVVPAGALASGAINASNLFGADVVVQSAIAANAIGADQIAAGSIIAGKIGANAVTAATVQAGAISADKIQSNAITSDKIDAGAITAVKIDAGAVTAAKIEAGAVTASKLESNLILSDLIIIGDQYTGSTLTPGRIELRGENQANPGIVAFKDGAAGVSSATFRLYTGNGRAYLSEAFVDGDVTLDGGTIRTDAVGSTRVEIQDSTPAVDFYSGSSRIGRIGPYSTGVRIYGSGSAYLTVTAGTVNAENSSFTADGISSTQRLAQSIWSNTGTGSYTVYRNAGGQLVPSSSDSRLKTDVVSIDSALSKINQLNPVTFRWAAGEADDVKTPGLIAQEVANVFAEDELFVVWSQDDPDAEGEFATDPVKSLEYVNLIPHLIKAVQELSQKNSELEARIATLEGN